MSDLPTLPRWLAPAVFAGALVAAAWRIPAAPPPAILPASAVAPMADALPEAIRLSPTPASQTRLPDGRWAVAWLEAGDAENAGIRLAVSDGKTWRDIGRIASRESTAAGSFMHAGQLGHPLLWAEGGWLHLWYESYPLGKALGATLLHTVSTDGGRHWQAAQRLSDSPFGGLGMRLGGPPLPLADGGLLLPLGDDGPWLRLSVTGQRIERLTRRPPEAVVEAQR